MTYRIQTERLGLRELELSDDKKMFELDTDEQVLSFLFGIAPPVDIGESRGYIEKVQQQYLDNGIGRWAVVEFQSGECIGWAGLKLESNVNGHDKFYDLGYRFLPRYWNKGYATEASIALVKFGFEVLKVEKICGYVDSGHKASRRVLEKAGLHYVCDFEQYGCNNEWFELYAAEYFTSCSSTSFHA